MPMESSTPSSLVTSVSVRVRTLSEVENEAEPVPRPAMRPTTPSVAGLAPSKRQRYLEMPAVDQAQQVGQKIVYSQ